MYHKFTPTFTIDSSSWGYTILASYTGRVGGEKRPVIYCLRMRERFRYISANL